MAWIRRYRFSRCPPPRSPAPRRSVAEIAGAARAVASQAPLAGRPFQDVAPRRRLVPFYEFDDRRFLPLRRRAGRRSPPAATPASSGSPRFTSSASPRAGRRPRKPRQRISDLQFTEAYRVPFQYSRLVREHLGTGAFVQSSAGVTVTDLDGNGFYDLTGSYGVNIFGYDFYKECIERGRDARARARPGARRLSSGDRRQRARGCARFPGSTKSRSTCPAPKR